MKFCCLADMLSVAMLSVAWIASVVLDRYELVRQLTSFHATKDTGID